MVFFISPKGNFLENEGSVQNVFFVMRTCPVVDVETIDG
jgi:hypothetical protein